MQVSPDSRGPYSRESVGSGPRQSLELRGVQTSEEDMAIPRGGSSTPTFVHQYPNCLRPSPTWGVYQIMWVILQSVVGGLGAFGINFGFTYLAVRGKEVTLFEFPIPMVGTLFIVILFTAMGGWFVSGGMMSLDVLHGRITPLDPNVLGALWPTRGSRLWKYFQISEFVAPTSVEASANLLGGSNVNSSSNSSSGGNDDTDTRIESNGSSGASCRFCAPGSPWSFPKLIPRVRDNILLSLPWSFFLICTLFPILIIISFFVWGDHGMRDFKLQPAFMAGFAGLFTNVLTQPFWAIISLASVGERYLHDIAA